MSTTSLPAVQLDVWHSYRVQTLCPARTTFLWLKVNSVSLEKASRCHLHPRFDFM